MIVYALRYHKNHGQYPGLWCNIDYASGGYLYPAASIVGAKLFSSRDKACNYLYTSSALELVELKIEEANK